MKQLRFLMLILIPVVTSGLLYGLVLANDSDFPACLQTLKQSPVAFLKSQPAAFSVQEAAALYWAGCKGQQNRQRLRGYPKLAARLEQLGKLEGEYVTAQRQLASLKNGGGTYNEARFAAVIELHFEALIRLTTSKAGAVTNPRIRSRYARAKLEIETRIARVIAKPQPYLEPGTNADPTALQSWRTWTLEYRKAYRQILALIGPRQNATSVNVLEFLDSSLFANEI